MLMSLKSEARTFTNIATTIIGIVLFCAGGLIALYSLAEILVGHVGGIIGFFVGVLFIYTAKKIGDYNFG